MSPKKTSKTEKSKNFRGAGFVSENVGGEHKGFFAELRIWERGREGGKWQ